jgi:hypothetical protein
MVAAGFVGPKIAAAMAFAAALMSNSMLIAQTFVVQSQPPSRVLLQGI